MQCIICSNQIKWFVCLSFSNEIEATLNRLKKLEKDLTVKERELRDVSYILPTLRSEDSLLHGFFRL